MFKKLLKITIGKRIFIGFLILIVAYLGWVLHIYSDMKEISALSEQSVPLNSEISALQEFALSMESLETDVDKFFTVNYKENQDKVIKDFQTMNSIIGSLKK